MTKIVKCTCGGKPQLEMKKDSEYGVHLMPIVVCHKCGKSVSYGILPKTCIEQWNTNQDWKE